VGLGVEQVSGVLAFLLNAHAQALAMLDQELRRGVVPTAGPARAPQPDDELEIIRIQKRGCHAIRARVRRERN
jgi:hypothetical protein